MNIKKNLYKYFFVVLCVSVLLFFLIGAYSDEQKSLDEVKKRPAISEPAEKEKKPETNSAVKEEQKITKRETVKKKVPAFWFLLPEK
ncbi:MAG: hypothetical protein ACP5UA_01840 [Candidatus Hydrogenedens sp.]